MGDGLFRPLFASAGEPGRKARKNLELASTQDWVFAAAEPHAVLPIGEGTCGWFAKNEPVHRF